MEDIAKEVKIKDTGMGEYTIESVLSLTSLLLSPKSYGLPSEKMKPTTKEPHVIFNESFIIKQVSKQESHEEEAILVWLYKDKSQSQIAQKCESKSLKVPSKSYGLGHKLISKM